MEIIEQIWPYLAALIPTVGVAFLFYWVVRYMIEADRSERKALAKWNAEHQQAPDVKGNMGRSSHNKAQERPRGGDASS
ncbi:hypothetical protein [Janibacter corallicola]|uniref:hypothetical protein n=1 Tax=Janibacter corallicola TaxID=415212 RepID=UPI000829F13B|nr:hypothetical protein [Janibacter corallicola]